MSSGRPRDLAASLRDRLLKLSRERGEVFEVTLLRFAVERLLYRLSKSAHRERFLLKGAMLFTVWETLPHRSTRDLDLLGRGSNDPDAVRHAILDILDAKVEPDGLEFDTESMVIEPLHEGQDYEGLQISLVARLAGARVTLRVDIAFGQAVQPEATFERFPSLLDLPTAELLVYPREVVVAEKFQAMVTLGLGNSRMKDFFDIAYLAGRFEFDSERLAQAMAATFERRKTPIPAEKPLALTSAYFESSERTRDWEGFRNRSGLEGDPATLTKACSRIAKFLMPLCGWILDGTVPRLRWRAKSGWTE